MLEIPILIIIIYFITAFFLSRFFIPHLNFGPDPLPDTLNADLKMTIGNLAKQAKSAEEFLNLSYEYIGKKYRSERFNTVFKFGYLFKSLDDFWQMEGFLPCTLSNFLMRIFLVKSGFFNDNDIKRKHTFVNFVPHQYLKVKLGNKWIEVDVGEKQRGLPLGKHLKFFG